MQSGLIGKVEKAKAYASERHRITVDDLHVAFHGENGDHQVAMSGGRWSCNCEFFSRWAVCSHTMALEHMLEGMVIARQQALPIPV